MIVNRSNRKKINTCQGFLQPKQLLLHFQQVFAQLLHRYHLKLLLQQLLDSPVVAKLKTRRDVGKVLKTRGRQKKNIAANSVITKTK